MNKEKIISIIASIFIASLGFLLIKNNNYFYERNIDKLSNEIIDSHSSSIENSILKITSSAIILGKHIEILKGDTNSFIEYSQVLYNQFRGVSNLQLAKDGIVSHIYPSRGHEKALGHNIFKDDKRKKEAFLAKNSNKLTLAGPFKLVQGGTAIIARKPIYIENKFWGFSSSLIMLEELIKNLKLDKLPNQGYSFRLSRIHPDTNKADIFYGKKELRTDRKFFTKTINVPNGRWYIDIQYTDSYLSEKLILLYIMINILVSILLGVFLYMIMKKPKEYIEV